MGEGIELWLVRHGETEWSLSGAHTSRTDIPLTARGRLRAEKLRGELGKHQFAAVLTSPMQRARETCSIAGLGGQAQVDDDLKEWDYGVYEGRSTPDIRGMEPGWSVWSSEITGGEAVEHVGERADRVIQASLRLAKAAPPESRRVALFAHAHILRILAARWINQPARTGQSFALGTGSLSRLGWERDTRVISSWNREFGDE